MRCNDSMRCKLGIYLPVIRHCLNVPSLFFIPFKHVMSYTSDSQKRVTDSVKQTKSAWLGSEVIYLRLRDRIILIILNHEYAKYLEVVILYRVI